MLRVESLFGGVYVRSSVDKLIAGLERGEPLRVFADRTLTPAWQAGTADYDYNDVMFGFRAAQVPEPGTLLLVGMCLAGLALKRRRSTAV